MSKSFAPDYPRNEQGWILFPRDVEWRRKLFPDGVFEHPAKANMFLIQELVRYLTEPGDVVLDPFGGTGTLLIGALEDQQHTPISFETPLFRSSLALKSFPPFSDILCNEFFF